MRYWIKQLLLLGDFVKRMCPDMIKVFAKSLLVVTPLAFVLIGPVISDQAYDSKGDIPIGTELINEGDSQFKGRTPSGESINIQLDDYDKWWLGKTNEERSEWLNIYFSGVKSGQLLKGVTFVQFMNVVMLKKLSLKHFIN